MTHNRIHQNHPGRPSSWTCLCRRGLFVSFFASYRDESVSESEALENHYEAACGCTVLLLHSLHHLHPGRQV